MPQSGAAALAVLAASFLLLLQRAATQECPGGESAVLTDQSLEEAYGDCGSVEGDLVLGTADCSSQCSLTSLSALSQLRSVSGSLIVQCCPGLEELSGLNQLTEVTGTLRLYYNQGLTSITGFASLVHVGSLEISQNGNLTQVTGFSSLQTVEGHIQINHNERLLNLDGLSGVGLIRGANLVAEHALSVLYNPALTDLRWLRNLTQIQFGTVHIEGNWALCYAGYPQWEMGSYRPRPPGGDRGIDWRELLGPRVPDWQYSWGSGQGYPTVVVQNNAPYEMCGDAECHEECEDGAGCLGPSNSDLCGSCGEGPCEIGATPTMTSCDPTSIPYWPPTKFPYSLVFGILFAVSSLVLLGLVALGGWVMCKICKRARSGRKNTFNINEEMEMVGMELKRRDTATSGIIAGTPSSLSHSLRRVESPTMTEVPRQPQKQQGGNVVLTSMSYKPLDDSVQTQHSPAVTPLTCPTATTVTTHTPHPHTTAQPPTVHPSLSPTELKVSLKPITEELEDEKESTDGAVRKIHKHDTLTRLQKGESAHVEMTFPRSQIKLRREIGKGDFGLVFFAEAKKIASDEKKTPVIVKQLKEDATKREQENFLRPVEAMSQLQHPNVVSLLGVCVDSSPIMILMEYCSHGNLKTYLVRKRREAAMFREGEKLIAIACQMAAGLSYLHSNSIAHNDFAVRSCQVSDTETVKLGDYGLTRQVFEEDYYSRGAGQKAWPVRWMAPEQMIVKGTDVLDSHQITTTANVWSFGVSLWEVGTFAQWPYFDLSNEEVIDTVQSSQQCSLENPFQPSDHLSPLYDIMQLCWKVADKRPTMAELVGQLEQFRDYIARNTPSSRKRWRIGLSHSPKSSTTPKSTTPRSTPTLQQRDGPSPKTTPNKPHPNTTPRDDSTKPHLTQESKFTTPTVSEPSHGKSSPVLAKPGQPQRVSGTKRKPVKSHSPRRPAPKIPEEGSLKRKSAINPVQAPINAHRHPLEKAIKVESEQKEKMSDEPTKMGLSMVPAESVKNPGFVEAEREKEVSNLSSGVGEGTAIFVNKAAEEENREENEKERDERGREDSATELEMEGGTAMFVNRAADEKKEEKGREERDGKNSVTELEADRGTAIFVNRAADKENEKEREEREDSPTELEAARGTEWIFEDEPGQEWGDEDFILDPPIDFSQPGVEDDDDFPQGDAYDQYNPNESQCTSIDDFEPIPHLPAPSPRLSLRTHTPEASSRAVVSPADGEVREGHKRVDSKHKKKKKKGAHEPRREKKKERGDGTQASQLLTYHSWGDIEPHEREGWGEQDFEEGEDFRYRRPTGQISSALLKRAPSWGRSGKRETEDDMPNVVYNDEIAALIW